MRISGGLGRAGAEHHAHQRGFGELEIHSNPSPTKLNFVGLAETTSAGRRSNHQVLIKWGGGGVTSAEPPAPSIKRGGGMPSRQIRGGAGVWGGAGGVGGGGCGGGVGPYSKHHNVRAEKFHFRP